MGVVVPALLPNAIAICLVAGMALSVLVRRPPRALRPVLLLYQLFVLLYLVGDAVTLVSTDLWAEQVGIALLYTGAIPAAAACWILAVRYAEAQGQPFPWARGWWIRGPIVMAALSWGAVITNPLHGLFLTPVIGANNEHLWGWWVFVPWGYALVGGSILLYALLAWKARDAVVRRNALLMAGAVAVTVGFNLLSYAPPAWRPFDLTVVGLGCASGMFLYGAYRTHLFSLLPTAVVESVRHDPNGLVLVDLQGGWLRSNPAASKLLGDDLKLPGRNVISLLARRLRGAEGESLREEELSRQLLQGPRAGQETIGPLRAGDGHWVEVIATPIPRFEGRARVVSLRFQDVSDRIAAEEQARRARHELFLEAGERRQVDRLLGEVLRDVDLAAAEVAESEGVQTLLARIRYTVEQARQMTGIVVPWK